MSALGQYLVEQHWLAPEELSAALLHQQDVGGRLGTSLLELDYLSEDQLLAALSAQQRTPTARAADLEGIEADITGLLPVKIASRHLAIPFRAQAARVDVALARTDNLAQLDELSFVIGKALRPHIAVEARLYQALEAYYRVPCPLRFRKLVEQLDLRASADPGEAERLASAAGLPGSLTPVPAARFGSGPRRMLRSLEPPTQRSIPLTEDQRQALQPTAGESSSSPPAAEPSFSDRLAGAETPDEIAKILLAALDEHFVRGLLFRVARRSVSGWLGHGPNIDRDWLAGYSVGLRQATVFRQIDRNGFFQGNLASNPAHDSLARCWGGGLLNECLVLAVRVRGRMVSAFYGDRGALGLRDLDREAVERLAGKAGLAFERLILDRKLRR